ncbi:uncharacterized protein isoform X2 [Rhodnius prolixus]|uniref:uncharacterized protein isoform X2 n=1 Tax=Rhodnius prolixus TaxID=13249 RepID=UPI003D18CF0A
MSTEKVLGETKYKRLGGKMCKKELIQQKNFGKRMPNEVGKPECSCLGVHNKYLGDDKGALPLEMQIELASYYRRRWQNQNQPVWPLVKATLSEIKRLGKPAYFFK